MPRVVAAKNTWIPPYMKIGNIKLDNPCILAPMAGVTDKPFRVLCKELGAAYAVSEMTTSDPRLWKSRKSALRLDHRGEPEPIGVQIAGSDPLMLANAAKFNVENGAQIIDINFGCPAKKVCKAWAGSALLQDEPLVGRLIEAVVQAVRVPVTVKIRTGWDTSHKNAVNIASIAEDCGAAMIAVHGRTRDLMYTGHAEFETVAEVKARCTIPVVANGDIDSPEKAQLVLETTGVDAIMIGRAAQGRPWIFREINHFLETGVRLPEPTPQEIGSILIKHLNRLYDHYGEGSGVRIARKHLGWYAKEHPESSAFRNRVNKATSAVDQMRISEEYFLAL
jgi:tRNA-dihydrouridine synthase B